MEFESVLLVASGSFEDVQKVFSLLVGRYSEMTAWVWRAVPSYNEMDKSFVRMDIDRILYWTPEDPECEEYMTRIAEILGKDGFALLEIGNSVSPDYHDYMVTTPQGECRAAYDQESARDVMNFLEKSYGKDMVSILYRSKDGYKELWDKNRQSEPPMPYKRESKPARTHEQVLQDDYLYRKSDASAEAFRGLLLDRRDLSPAYEAFREAFEAVKADPARLERDDACILVKRPCSNAVYEKVSLGIRLERAEAFTFRGKIFHIHGNSTIVELKSVDTDPKLKELAGRYEDDLRVAIARRGGIIDDYDYDRNRLKYVDCCVMVDNEDQRYWDWTDKFSHNVDHFGLELISRFALWYAIARTPEMSVEEREELADSSFYSDAIEAKNTKVLEAEEVLKAEMEERRMQWKLEEEAEFAELMKLLKEKYGEERAASCAQIENEVILGDKKYLISWNSVKNYIKEQYNMTAAAYFKQEGLTGKKDAAKKEPEKKTVAPKAEPVKKAAPARKKEAENPLISFMRSAAESRGLTLEDLLGLKDDGDLDMDDFVIEDDEDDELVLAFKKDVEDIVAELTKKYNGKPRFASYAALKKENPDVFWEDAEDTIKRYIHSTPAAYFKEAGLVRSGQAKEQLIGKAAEKKEAPKAEPVKKEPAKKEPVKKTAPAPKKEPEKKATPAPKSVRKPAAKPSASAPVESTEKKAMNSGVNRLNLPGKTKIEESQYLCDSDTRPLEVPEGILTIETNAFLLAKMSSVKLPKSLKTIGGLAFNACPNLASVEIQEGLEEIGFYAFGKCPKLTNVRLPSTIQKIDRNAFTEDDLVNPASKVTLHMRGDAACRVEKNNPYRGISAVVAAGFMIDGNWYSTLERYVEMKETQEKARIERERAEQRARAERERKERERREAEARKEQQRNSILKQIHDLETERDSVKGLFAGLKKNKIQKQIDELKEKMGRI